MRMQRRPVIANFSLAVFGRNGQPKSEHPRRRRTCLIFMKGCCFVLVAFSTTERTDSLSVGYKAFSQPLIRVDFFAPMTVFHFGPLSPLKAQLDLTNQNYERGIESRRGFVHLEATPSTRQTSGNNDSSGVGNQNRTMTSRPLNRKIARPIATERESDRTVEEPKVVDSRRLFIGKSRGAMLLAKLEETRRQRQAAKEDATQAPPLTQAYCDYLLAECVANDEWELVLDVLDLMKEANLQQVRSTYTACLQACFQTANAASAREILSAMALSQIPPETSDFALAILAMCRKDQTEKGWWRKALQLLEVVTLGDGNDDLPVAVYDAILTCMVKEQQWKSSLRLIRRMEQPFRDETARKGTRPALSTYRTVVECCVASNQAELAVQVLQSCVANGLTPTPYAFELVIGALSKKTQWRRALQLLDLMETLSVPRSLQIYNFVLTSCAKAREAVQAKALLQRMRRRDGIAPNIISYNSVVSACASTSRWRDALAVLDQVHRAPSVTPDVYTYTNAIRACAKGGKTERALSLFRVVKDKGLPLDSYCYTAAIEACDWQQALKLLAEMEERGIVPSEVTFSVTIKACGEGGQWRKALDLVECMRRREMPINLYVYNAAITAVSKAAKQGSKTGAGDGQLWSEVKTLLEHMRLDGIEPDGFSFSSAISCCGSEGRWEEALGLIDEMLMGGPRTRPNKVAYTAAVYSCGRAGQVDHALRLFRQMKDQGLSADCVAYNALFSALRVSKKSDAAFALWDEMMGHPSSPRGSTTIASATSSTIPDAITISDAIGAMESEFDDESNRLKIDKVFAEAVRLGIILREDTHLSCWEFDLTSMSFPVARAACRFVVNRIQRSTSVVPSGLTFIAGNGAQRQTISGFKSLRVHVQEILLNDFKPGLVSTVPDQAQVTVQIDPTTLSAWLRKQ